MIEEVEHFEDRDTLKDYRLLIRCTSLNVKSKTFTQSTSLFSSFMNMTSGGNAPLKNEKRYIKVLQSSSFLPEQKIGSMIFDLVYQSEVIEENPNISPSLLADIICPPGKDVRIRIVVYYSSNVTSNKDVVLCSCDISFRQLVQEMKEHGMLISPMQSEHTSGAKVFVEIVTPLRPMLQDSCFQLFAPINDSVVAPNPLFQKYVFYGEDDPTLPLVDVEEYVWEPRLAMKLSLLFIDNVRLQAFNSYQAWSERLVLEEMRQGEFYSNEMAQASGWNTLNVSVCSARINCPDVSNAPRKRGSSSTSSVRRIGPTSSSSSGRNGSSADGYSLSGGEDSHGSTPTSGASPMSSVATDRSQNTTIYMSHFPIYKQGGLYKDANGSLPSYSSTTSSTVSVEYSQSMPANAAGSIRDVNTGGNSANAAGRPQGRGGRKKTKVDDSLPSTFVEMYYDDPNLLFSYYLGRTNTEYHSFHPVFGSNVNAPWARKATTNFIAGPATNVDKTTCQYNFAVLESTNRYASPRIYHPNQLESSSDYDAEYAAYAMFDMQSTGSDSLSTSSIQGYEAFLSRNVPSIGGKIRFDMYLEDSSGSRSPILIGTGSTPAEAVTTKQHQWIALSPITSSSFLAFDSIEIFVSMELIRSTVIPQIHSYSSTSSRGSILESQSAGDKVSPEAYTNIAPCCMPDVIKVSRKPDGTVVNSQEVTEFRVQMSQWQRLQPQLATATSSSLPDVVAPTKTDASTYTQSLPLPAVKIVSAAKSSSRPAKDIDDKSDDESDSDIGDSEHATQANGASNEAVVALRDGTEVDIDLDSDIPSLPPPPIPTNLTSQPAVPVLAATPFQLKMHAFPNSINDLSYPSQIKEADTDILSRQGELDLFPERDESGNADAAPLFFPDYRASIARSYEWLWHVGFNGLDPLSDDSNQAKVVALDTCVVDISTIESDAAVKARGMSADATVENLVDDVKSVGGSVGDSNVCLVLPRVDVPYPTSWLRAHIDAMQNLFTELQVLRSESQQWLLDGHQFRPSAMKKEMNVQFLPTNLHIQLMNVRRHGDASNPVEVVDSITSGCMSPHGLGHKKGGLTVMEEDLLKQKVRIDVMKERFRNAIGSRKLVNKIYESRSLSSGGASSGFAFDSSAASSAQSGARSASASPQTLPPLSPTGGEAELLDELGRLVFQYETSCMAIGRRRIFAISQAVSTAATAFLLKLNLVMEGIIDETVADRWLSLGFLIVFEGLLSVSGKEKNMIEDTQSALDALRLYQIRLLPSPPATAAGAMSSSSAPTTFNTLRTNLQGSHIDASVMDVGFSGREIRIYIPSPLVRKLPPSYRVKIADQGAVLSLLPLLFTQGIDMNQTLAASFSLDSNSATQLQLQINLRSFRQLNSYCSKVLPLNVNPSGARAASTPTSVDTAATSLSTRRKSTGPHDVHPLLRQLNDSIKNADASAKNVDMLLEVERACLLLNGCRVTFCKSGKDRTGMAVTLEQSRQLGDRFRLGDSPERLLRDANLFRLHGTRLGVAFKNIGKKVFSFNRLQVSFLPVLYRPPLQVCEQMIKGGKDTS